MAPAASSSSEARRPSQPHPTTTTSAPSWAIPASSSARMPALTKAPVTMVLAPRAASKTRIPFVVERATVEPGGISEPRISVGELPKSKPATFAMAPLPYAEVRLGSRSPFDRSDGYDPCALGDEDRYRRARPEGVDHDHHRTGAGRPPRPALPACVAGDHGARSRAFSSIGRL